VFIGKTGAPEEIRTPDPQMRGLLGWRSGAFLPLSSRLEAFFAQEPSDKNVPLFHRRAFFWHVVPAIIVL
jgi:hypothetical protein